MVGGVGIEVRTPGHDDHLTQQADFRKLVQRIVYGGERNAQVSRRSLCLKLFRGDVPVAVLEQEARKTKPLPRLGGGSVRSKISVLNQENQVVQRGEMVLLVKSKLE